MPGIDYRQARAQLSLPAVLELLGWQPCWRRGPQWRGPCPLHGSHSARSRSFAVHVGKNVYHCFRCGAGGNALDLYAALTHQELFAATVELCNRLGQVVPWLPPATREQTMSDP